MVTGYIIRYKLFLFLKSIRYSFLRKAGGYASPPHSSNQVAVDVCTGETQGWSLPQCGLGLGCPVYVGLLFSCSEWVWKTAAGRSYSFNQKRKPSLKKGISLALVTWPLAVDRGPGWGVMLGREEEFLPKGGRDTGQTKAPSAVPASRACCHGWPVFGRRQGGRRREVLKHQ